MISNAKSLLLLALACSLGSHGCEKATDPAQEHIRLDCRLFSSYLKQMAEVSPPEGNPGGRAHHLLLKMLNDKLGLCLSIRAPSEESEKLKLEFTSTMTELPSALASGERAAELEVFHKLGDIFDAVNELPMKEPSSGCN